MPRKIMSLTKHQVKILELINVATNEHQVSEFTYKSEWLGYLPFGQYHWIEVCGSDIKVNSDIDLHAELTNLEKLNLISTLSVKEGVYEKEDIHINYVLNRHITSQSSGTKNSWLSSLHILTNYFCPLKWALGIKRGSQ
jgi:hypothetical protein